MWNVIRRALADPMAVLRRHPSSGRYRPEIDGLRFFAIAVVVVGHIAERTLRFAGAPGPHEGPLNLATLLAAPGAGVLLFFAISGFIIASQAVRQRDRLMTRSYLANYFSRRLQRIEPPYFLLLIATFLLVTLTHFQPQGSVRFEGEPHSLPVSLIASILYAHGWLFGNFPRLFPPGWSLEIEVQFYVVAPFLFMAYFAVRHPGARAAAGLGLLAVWVVLAVLTPFRHEAVFTQNTILRYIAFFWVGILAADFQTPLRAWLERRPPALSAGLGWIGLLIFLAADMLIDSRTPLPGTLFTLAILAGTFGMFCGVFGQGSFRAFCASGPISVIGGQCYSIYLVHLQTVQIMSIAAAKFAGQDVTRAVLINLAVETPTVILVGMVFYVLVERPFMIDHWPAKLKALLTGRPQEIQRPDGEGR